MHILLIDNGTTFLDRLQELLKHETVSVRNTNDLNEAIINAADAIILSGGHGAPVLWGEDVYAKEKELILHTQKPLFGICLGFELIAQVFGADIELMQCKEKGTIELEILESEPLFKDLPNLSVYESHRWVVAETGENLIPLARSGDGIEAIKHKNRPIYGTQFHPEMFPNSTCGDEVFRNFLKTL